MTKVEKLHVTKCDRELGTQVVILITGHRSCYALWHHLHQQLCQLATAV